ncbi:hypothetical protein ISALK_09285 [Isachenkonia alkalipeptolytica]|uniref:Uncharacterized protein n=1 Tax=Isachenkonia alkalipeptolytica TaxID=2565777 RepID=A0AA44BE96_9CLOT|nr:hypothetical protein [Isachenkonia alkalipeptolytica]
MSLTQYLPAVYLSTILFICSLFIYNLIYLQSYLSTVLFIYSLIYLQSYLSTVLFIYSLIYLQ